jgi:hypothetical protein
MTMTARFKVEDYFILEILSIDFSGPRTNRRIIAPQKEIDFAIHNYVEYHHHYDLIILDTTVGVMDGGEIRTIINIPKSMVTIANKHLKNDNKSEQRLDN